MVELPTAQDNLLLNDPRQIGRVPTLDSFLLNDLKASQQLPRKEETTVLPLLLLDG